MVVAVTCVDSGDKALEYLSLLDTQQTDSDSKASSSSPQSAKQEVRDGNTS